MIKSRIEIGIIGDYDSERPSHKATNEALAHCAALLDMDAELHWLPTESLVTADETTLAAFDGLWCAPGSPYNSMKGALNAIRFARENDIPFIGTCGGFQHAVLEYAQNKLGCGDISHPEYNPYASALFISALSCSLVGETRTITINKGSRVYRLYGQAEVEERYNCSFGLNPDYQKQLDASGFKVVGVDASGEARILELARNRFYVATLFQPQLSSSPAHPHKLITAYLCSARAYQSEMGREQFI